MNSIHFKNTISMNRQVLYSIAMPLNRGGMGTIAWHACRALQKASLLGLVLATETGAAQELHSKARSLPWFFRKGMAVLNRMHWYQLHDSAFDHWVSKWIKPGMDYYGWMNQSLFCIRKCHRMGGRTFVDRGSVEPKLQQRWLIEEYAKYGLNRKPMSQAAVQRMTQEAEETDAIVTPSTFVANSYLEAGYDEKKIHINSLGVDLPKNELIRPEGRKEVFRFVFIGQLSIQKGIPTLLQAWQKLNPSKSELVLAGIIPSEEESIIKPLLKSTRQVIWNGHCQKIDELLQTCDVLILPSAQDGFGLVVLEAMAHGLPVIISHRVGAKDCVVEGKNGFIFPFNDPQTLEDRMAWFLQDHQRAALMSLSAKETARNHSWESYGQRFVSLFKKTSFIDT